MTDLVAELVATATRINAIANLPNIAQVILPPLGSTTQSKYSKFGLMILTDGSAGFFYRLLDEDHWLSLYSESEIATRLHACVGTNPVDLTTYYFSEDPLDRGLGMAAINATTQHLLKTINYALVKPTRYRQQSDDATRITAANRVGMVGYFTPMVAALCAAQVPTTVIEIDESLFQETEKLTVCGDLNQLAHCDLIFCTASTLLNHSLEHVLSGLTHNPWIELIGPTAGCLPDPFFARGVNRVGGSQVKDVGSVVEKIATLQPWSTSVEKYEIDAQHYEGMDALLLEYQKVRCA